MSLLKLTMKQKWRQQEAAINSFNDSLLIVAIYSSAHSSRSGTANGGYSHQPSPISMSHSMASSPMAPMNHSPYPVQHSPMPARMQPSPAPQLHPGMSQSLHHSPLPPDMQQQPMLQQMQNMSMDYR